MSDRQPDMPTDPQTACAVLLASYDDGAGTEALLRAFISERDRRQSHALFWIDVYGLILMQREAKALPPSGRKS
jgi:hypothetical protein